jgi:hypothetical protein
MLLKVRFYAWSVWYKLTAGVTLRQLGFVTDHLTSSDLRAILKIADKYSEREARTRKFQQCKASAPLMTAMLISAFGVFAIITMCAATLYQEGVQAGEDRAAAFHAPLTPTTGKKAKHSAESDKHKKTKQFREQDLTCLDVEVPDDPEPCTEDGACNMTYHAPTCTRYMIKPGAKAR